MLERFFSDPPEWFRVLRGFPAYYALGAVSWLHWKLLPYAGDWAYRADRIEARRQAGQLDA